MNVALFFGSFNPIHVGHLIIAQHILNHTKCDELWFVVSPQNPHKEKQTLLADYHRLALVRLAIENEPKLKASDIEFGLPQPSYTIDTLAHLFEKYPQHHFSLVMGEDNLKTLHKWKNYEQILNKCSIYVYPRIDNERAVQKSALYEHPSIKMLTDVPQLNISASHIRKQIQSGKSVKFMLTAPVLNYVEEMHFYKN